MPVSLWPWLVPTKPVCPTMREIAADVAERHGLTLDELRGPQRHKRLRGARFEAMWEAYETGLWSNQQIGNFFGSRDHTSVMNARRQHAKWNGLGRWSSHPYTTRS